MSFERALLIEGSGKAVPKGYLPSCGHLYPSTPFFEFWVDINKPKAKDMYAVAKRERGRNEVQAGARASGENGHGII